MIKFGKGIVRFKLPILIVSVLLLIPSVFGMIATRVNYDILSYLPEDIETMQGQNILLDEFEKGAFSMVMVDGMADKDVVKVKEKIESVEQVASVIWYDSILDISVPKEIIPDNLYQKFNSDSSTLMVVFFKQTTSADETMDAISEVRQLTGKQCFISGMSAVVTDTKDLSNKETPIYVLIAVILSSIILALTMDSYLIPLFFMLSIGMAILYNMGTNYFMGEISYITKALSAVLQLGVTMDYSIFLWHSYEEQKVRYSGDKDRAMAHAISNTITSVLGGSVTTIAGFVALCFMSFTLGMNLGLVMAKGVIFGVIGCVTVLPSMLLIFDSALEKTKHKPVVPDFGNLAKGIVKHYLLFVILFLVILAPAIYGYTHTQVYYNLDSTLPKTLDSIIANSKLEEEYNMNTTHMVLASSSLEAKKVNAMLNEMSDVEGISFALGFNSLVGAAVPEEAIPKELIQTLKSENWQLMLVGSEYKVASDEVNDQIDVLNEIVKRYDSTAMVIGEAPCTKDLIEITNTDFKVVSIISIGAIFILIALVLKSISLPIILVSVIEFAIFINMGIPCFMNTKIPFIASIVIGTIQLGATVDYAILMTTRYKKERFNGMEKRTAIEIAVSSSIKSIMVSAFGFFAATFGVGLYSNIDMISSLCTLMARGAIISMFVVILVLPSLFVVFDKIICNTSIGFKKKGMA
ncbi:efflux RND transporter permease subunit [Anaeromicropila populeti]|uniref:Membrane transport protein MMPL domain-containing protein n=1 Tax=Anaeromicropila populeti TaxID=37658 RepID=A0A1I6J1X7_9FIRM|nr:MMPL family transporter [Anaeromicropila populeti]SFR72871.1 hypothetical protein SAMN05661086_01358 [Anaeromicropila populeti]